MRTTSEKYFRELFNKFFTEIQRFCTSCSHLVSEYIMGGKVNLRGNKKMKKKKIKYEQLSPFLLFSFRLHLDNLRKGKIIRG